MPRNNQRGCRAAAAASAAAAGGSSLRECCTGLEALAEDVPMRRYSNPIPISTSGCASGGGCTEALSQIQEALACQNQLLTDLLGAVNCLTATLLSERAAPHGG